MTRELFERIEGIFHTTLKREPSQRADFLVKACGRDNELRQEVEALLDSHEQAGDFMAEPALEVMARQFVEKQTRAQGEVKVKYCPKCQTEYSGSERVCENDNEQLFLRPDPYHLVGKTFSQFHIVGLVALGGMGAVYRASQKAEQFEHGRRVAFKILKPDLWLDGRYEFTAFEREVKIAANLSHENLVVIHYWG
ncbi:MAG: hypothetical protein MOB07_25250, partial [Acidobacteria bacterium]|nr:hypothetical protein [Acidobacteriota bacterium]